MGCPWHSKLRKPHSRRWLSSAEGSAPGARLSDVSRRDVIVCLLAGCFGRAACIGPCSRQCCAAGLVERSLVGTGFGDACFCELASQTIGPLSRPESLAGRSRQGEEAELDIMPFVIRHLTSAATGCFSHGWYGQVLDLARACRRSRTSAASLSLVLCKSIWPLGSMTVNQGMPLPPWNFCKSSADSTLA